MSAPDTDGIAASRQSTGGPTFAADQINSQIWPYAKLAFGPNGTATEVDDADGSRLPVKGEFSDASFNTFQSLNENSAPAASAHVLFDVAANASRSGWLFQNQSAEPLQVWLGPANDFSNCACFLVGPGSLSDTPGGFFGSRNINWSGRIRVCGTDSTLQAALVTW